MIQTRSGTTALEGPPFETDAIRLFVVEGRVCAVAVPRDLGTPWIWRSDDRVWRPTQEPPA